MKHGAEVGPEKRDYLNDFDEAEPPQELRDVRDQHGGVISRVWNGRRHGWRFKCLGSLSSTSRALLRAHGFGYQSRKWWRWDGGSLGEGTKQ